MPRFTGQNKKSINPRYFLNEIEEAKGSGSGDGIGPDKAEELVRAAANKHRPGRAPILSGTLQRLIQWGRKNLPGMTTSEARKAIEDKMK